MRRPRRLEPRLDGVPVRWRSDTVGGLRLSRRHARISVQPAAVLIKSARAGGPSGALLPLLLGGLRCLALCPMLNAGTVSRWAPLPLRLIVGYGFIVHGFAKLSRGPDTFAAILHTLGVPLPHLLAWLTTLVELVGGSAILAGAFVPLAAVPMAI